jgi:hypothetical protein
MSKKLTDKASYMLLGVLIDYFLFKPVRVLKPLWTFWVGFVFGLLCSVGIEGIASFFQFVINLFS